MEKNIFHLRSLANVVNDHVASATGRLLIDDDTDVGSATTQIPSAQVAWCVISRSICHGQCFSLALEENHQIRNPTMVDVRVRMGEQPAPLVRICRKIPLHVLVNLLLQIDPDGTVAANNFIRANARVGGNVPAGVRNSDIGRNITDRMMGALDGGGHQSSRELLTRSWDRGLGGGKTPQGACAEHERQDEFRFCFWNGWHSD